MAKATRTDITADSSGGRILLALRAGKMFGDQISERNLNNGNNLARLFRLGFVEKDSEGAYCLTDAGRAACPTRRKTAEDKENSMRSLNARADTDAARKHRTQESRA